MKKIQPGTNRTVTAYDYRRAQEGYFGNPKLKKTRVPIEWSKELIEEYQKCKEDPIYFAEKYIQIINLDLGLIPIQLYDYQKEIITAITNSRRVAVCTSRQAGKCVHKDTKIKIRNKKTNQICEMTIGDLYELKAKK